MTYDIQNCSPKAERRIKSRIDMIGCDSESSNVGAYSAYPFGQMRIGDCFTIPIDQVKSNNIRVVASYHTKNGKRFTVIKHNDYQCYEIARIA